MTSGKGALPYSCATCLWVLIKKGFFDKRCPAKCLRTWETSITATCLNTLSTGFGKSRTLPQGPQSGERLRLGVMSNQAGMNIPVIRGPGGSPYLQFRAQPLAQVPGTIIPQGSLALAPVTEGTGRQRWWLRGVQEHVPSPTGRSCDLVSPGLPVSIRRVLGALK